MKGNREKGIWLQSLGDFQWAIKSNGRVIGKMHYNEIRDYILGIKPKEELLERFRVTDDQQNT